MIGDLYNTNNVVVGQAACMVAPANTALPDPSAAVMTDPFSLAPWTGAVLQASTPLTAGSFTLTYTIASTVYTTAALQYNATAPAIQTAIINALATFPAGPPQPGQVIVTGTAMSGASGGYLTIILENPYFGGVWSMTPTGITGGVITISNPSWTPVGATDQGWTFASNKSTTAINIEEQSAPVMMTMTTQSLTISGALSEDIAPTLAMAYNMLSTVYAPTTKEPGYTELNPTDTVLLYAVALTMANRLGYPRWLYIPQATCLANASGAFRRAAAKRMYTADFQSVCPISTIAILNFTAPHS